MGKVQKIKEEIERRINLLQNGDADPEVMKRVEGVLLAYNSILEFIDSIPEESGCEVNFTTKNEDLEREIGRYTTNCLLDKRNHSTGIYHLTQRNCDDIARHFAEWQKQQMMKDAVECVVEDWCGDSPEVTIPLNPQDFKIGEKVKIIIVKDEQQ